MSKLTQERLKELFYYDPTTGEFTRIKAVKGNEKGKIAGDIKSNGYRYIGIDYERHLAHRLAFLYMEGKIPQYVDHVNRKRSDNRWENLRAATSSQNGFNSKDRKPSSGIKNVYWDKKKKQYYAQIRAGKYRVTKVCGKDLEFAELVAQELRDKYHRDFAYV